MKLMPACHNMPIESYHRATMAHGAKVKKMKKRKKQEWPLLDGTTDAGSSHLGYD